jgi:hypothetical protein
MKKLNIIIIVLIIGVLFVSSISWGATGPLPEGFASEEEFEKKIERHNKNESGDDFMLLPPLEELELTTQRLSYYTEKELNAPYNLWYFDQYTTPSCMINKRIRGYVIGVTVNGQKYAADDCSTISCVFGERSGIRYDSYENYLYHDFYENTEQGEMPLPRDQWNVNHISDVPIYYITDVIDSSNYVKKNNLSEDIIDPEWYTYFNYTIPPRYFEENIEMHNYQTRYCFLIGNCVYVLSMRYALTTEELNDPEYALEQAQLSQDTAFAIAENLINQGKELNLGGAWLNLPQEGSPYYVEPGTTAPPAVICTPSPAPVEEDE